MDFDEPLSKFIEVVKNSNNIVFFGGAGVSTESNIPDFRSSKGLYSSENTFVNPPETILSHTFFMNHTQEFYKFYLSSMIYKNALPNEAHKALVKLEKLGKLKTTITQNIDNLHQMAGSKSVLELHGSVYRNNCMKCNKSYSVDYILQSNDIPVCSVCEGLVKPDVVLYGEPLNMDVINSAIRKIASADTLIIGGTSLVVYPAASLIKYFNGKHLILVNKSETQYDDQASIVINDSIGKTLKAVVDRI